MSSEIDPAKLKVVELRAELSSRGLDSKGNKAVLVKRLKDALEKELEQELPDTSIADTSTEDLNSSQEVPTETQEIKTDKSPDPKPPSEPTDLKDEQPEVIEEKATPEKVNEEKIESKPVEEKSDTTEEKSDTAEEKPDTAEEKPDTAEEPEALKIIEENGENVKDRKDEEAEPRNKKSRWGAEEVVEKNTDDKDCVEQEEAAEVVEKEPVDEVIEEEKKEEDSEMLECEEKKDEKAAGSEPGSEQRGDKRRRSSTSPTRSQRRRSRSPIKEDEPAIDNNKVQLNWYDSDLHLQIDKESFLSARPYHDGAFGYVWAGVRASHGAKSGKVCFEVKITEELKWDDIIKQQERSRRDRDRRDSRRDRNDRNSKSEGDSKKKDGKKSHEESDTADVKIAEAEQDPADKTDIPKEIEKTDDKPEKMDDQPEKMVDEPEKMDDEPEDTVEKANAPDAEPEDKPEESKKDEELKKEDSAEPVKESEEVDEDEKMETDEKETKEETDVGEANKEKEVQLPTHLIRIGWSMINTDLQLGEVKHSYGYESSGKFFNDKQFVEYGKAFSVGDVIGAFVEFGAENVVVTYTVNGEELPAAVEVPRSELPEDFALFPHVLSRNFAFEINLGNREEAWFPKPGGLDDYVYVEQVEEKISGPIRPESRSDCEIIMMCGLPASGKTHWLQEYVKENLEKRYTVIGNTQLLEKMTVNGNPLRNNIKGRWNVVLEKLSKCLNKLVEIAAVRRRNYVIDQTNVFPSAQRRKMRPFEGFKRRAVIVVCGDEEQAKRQALQEAQDGKDVADIAVLEMKANMSLPRVGDWIEEVTYVELNEEESKAMVQKYNKQGKDAGFGPFFQRRDSREEKRWHNSRRTDYRGGYRERSYQRYERGSKHGGGGGGWQNRSQVSGWSRNDRRDSRGSSGGSRDWRNNNRGGSAPRHQDRGRDRDRSSHGSRDTYSRNRSQGSSRGQGGNWQGSGNWGGQGNWAAQGATWQQGQSGGGNWNQGWSQPQGQGQGKWNYNSQNYSQQGYTNYPNWNYYGQYQNWNAQGQPHQPTGTNSGSTQAWAQYAQQYAQSNTANQHSSAQK